MSARFDALVECVDDQVVLEASKCEAPVRVAAAPAPKPVGGTWRWCRALCTHHLAWLRARGACAMLHAPRACTHVLAAVPTPAPRPRPTPCGHARGGWCRSERAARARPACTCNLCALGRHIPGWRTRAMLHAPVPGALAYTSSQLRPCLGLLVRLVAKLAVGGSGGKIAPPVVRVRMIFVPPLVCIHASAACGPCPPCQRGQGAGDCAMLHAHAPCTHALAAVAVAVVLAVVMAVAVAVAASVGGWCGGWLRCHQKLRARDVRALLMYMCASPAWPTIMPWATVRARGGGGR